MLIIGALSYSFFYVQWVFLKSTLNLHAQLLSSICHCFSKTTDSKRSMWACFCDWDVLMEIKEGVIQLVNGSRGKGKAGFWGFIYPPLIKRLWQRPGSDKGRGQVWFSDQLLACQTITAAGLKAAHCLSASRTSQHREGVGGRLTPNTEKLLIQGELGWLHRIVTYKRVMSLVLMYVNQEKRTSSRIQRLDLNHL